MCCFRHFMTHSQLGNGVISHGANTPYDDNAMPKGHCDWYPFYGWVRCFSNLPNDNVHLLINFPYS